MNITLYEMAKHVNGTVIGDGNLRISTLSPIDNIQADSLIFADGSANFKIAEASAAKAILVNKAIESSTKPLIQVNDPFEAFIQLIEHFYPPKKSLLGIHPTAIIEENVVIGENVAIGPYVVIEANAVIGNNCVIKSHVNIGPHVTIGCDSVLHSHVVVYADCQIGSRVIIHASTVLGSDGFGYTLSAGRHRKIPHAGCVIIEDNVEIGANSVIDRATLGATIIGEGTKIDNFVQIAHSVRLGKHNILCAFTGIAGSTVSGNHVVFAADVGVSDHVRIDDEVILAARTGVPPRKHLKKGNIYLGSPARPKEKAIEQELSLARIPFISKQIKALRKKMEILENQMMTAEIEKHD